MPTLLQSERRNGWLSCRRVPGRLPVSELLTVAQVATVLKVSEDTVVRRFAKVKGVIDLGVGETRHKRRYRVLRIPVAVVEGHLAKLSGTTVRIELPDK